MHIENDNFIENPWNKKVKKQFWGIFNFLTIFVIFVQNKNGFFGP
jgi:hypothetical protein